MLSLIIGTLLFFSSLVLIFHILNNSKPQRLEMLFRPPFCVILVQLCSTLFSLWDLACRNSFLWELAKEKYTWHNHNMALKLMFIMSIDQDTHPNLVPWGGNIHSFYKQGHCISNRNTI